MAGRCRFGWWLWLLAGGCWLVVFGFWLVTDDPLIEHRRFVDSFLSESHFRQQEYKCLLGLVALLAGTGSFDFVRLAPHFAQDDRVEMGLEFVDDRRLRIEVWLLKSVAKAWLLTWLLMSGDSRLPLAVSVHYFHAVAGFAQVFADIFGDHYGAVLASGASEADGQVALAFADIMRKQVDKQIGDAVDEFLGLREGADVFGHARISARERAELGHEMRIGEKAHIEDQVGIFGNSVLEAEADAGDQDVFVTGFFLEAFGKVRAQFVHVEFRGIDHPVGDGADGLKPAALGTQRGAHGRVRAERMRAASLTEAPNQGGVGSLEINHHRRDEPPD